MEKCHFLTLKLFQTCMNFFLLLNIEDILNNADQQLFGYILQNIMYKFNRRKTHTGLENIEGEEIMAEFKGDKSWKYIIRSPVHLPNKETWKRLTQ